VKQEELLMLERRISAERFAPYRAAMGGDPHQALTLYERNTALSAAFWVVLCDVEVLVRNAMHERLTEWSTRTYGQSLWFLDAGGVFNAETANDIATARRYATLGGRSESAGRVVAELPLGFWRYLLSSRYERSLWMPCLRGAFPGIPGRGMRRDVHDAMRDLHLLRNRIAHHEPIHNRPLLTLHRLALTVADWVCPVTRQWISSRSQVPALLAGSTPARP
jgi:hypothetical protein